MVTHPCRAGLVLAGMKVRQLLFCITLLLFLGCASAGSGGDGLADVLARHAGSRGGTETLESVRAMKARLQVEEPRGTVDIVYVADRAGRARVDVFAGGKRVFSEGVDERGGWSMGESGPVREISAAGRAALERGRLYNLYGLHELPKLGHQVVLEGREQIGPRTFDVLRLELADGFKTWRVLDARTGQALMARDRRALHPDLDPTETWIETRYYDFRAVDGVVMPFTSRQTEVGTGQWLQTTTFESVEINPRLSDAELRRPT